MSEEPGWEIVASCGMWEPGMEVGPQKEALSAACIIGGPHPALVVSPKRAVSKTAVGLQNE